MKLFLVFTSLIFLINFISASCNETQININSASLEDMMKIKGLGGTGVTAQKVIDARPFNSLDDLTKVSGIKEGKLADIKTQGLACIGDYVEKEDKNKTAEIQTNVTVIETAPEKTEEIPEQVNAEPQIIRLGGEVSKDIKSNSDFGNLYKSKILWLAVFGMFVGILLGIKKYKEKRNEF